MVAIVSRFASPGTIPLLWGRVFGGSGSFGIMGLSHEGGKVFLRILSLPRVLSLWWNSPSVVSMAVTQSPDWAMRSTGSIDGSIMWLWSPVMSVGKGSEHIFPSALIDQDRVEMKWYDMTFSQGNLVENSLWNICIQDGRIKPRLCWEEHRITFKGINKTNPRF